MLNNLCSHINDLAFYKSSLTDLHGEMVSLYPQQLTQIEPYGTRARACAAPYPRRVALWAI